MCMGNATQWNWCYFPRSSGTQTATIAVYRACSQSFNVTGCASGKYALVPGGSADLNSNASLNGNPYACLHASISAPFTVWSGDILVACVPLTNGLRIVASMSGSQVNHLNGTNDCTSLVDLSSGTNRTNRVILISLGEKVAN